MNTILFACVENAGRSQMAAALFSLIADPSKAQAISAGTRPGERVHPAVVEVMRELGVELGGVVPRKLTEDVASQAQVLVTMGCGDQCPFVPGARVEDWPLSDPKGQPIHVVRQIRDEIRARVEDLIARDGLSKAPA
jgi:arsenate reductase (thioredoxin)